MIWKFPWYLLPADLQKDFLFIMMNVAKSSEINLFYIGPLNLETFVTVNSTAILWKSNNTNRFNFSSWCRPITHISWFWSNSGNNWITISICSHYDIMFIALNAPWCRKKNSIGRGSLGSWVHKDRSKLRITVWTAPIHI
jgi:hypothetical protein